MTLSNLTVMERLEAITYQPSYGIDPQFAFQDAMARVERLLEDMRAVRAPPTRATERRRETMPLCGIIGCMNYVMAGCDLCERHRPPPGAGAAAAPPRDATGAAAHWQALGRSAVEAAQEVIGQCDCIMAETSERDPKRLWREARDAFRRAAAAPAPAAPGEDLVGGEGPAVPRAEYVAALKESGCIEIYDPAIDDFRVYELAPLLREAAAVLSRVAESIGTDATHLVNACERAAVRAVSPDAGPTITALNFEKVLELLLIAPDDASAELVRAMLGSPDAGATSSPGAAGDVT